MKSWRGKFDKLPEQVYKCSPHANVPELVKGSLDAVTPVVLTTRQAKYVRDCLLKAYNPRKAVASSQVSLSCIGFKHRGEILWMTNLEAMLHDIKKIAKKNRNEAAEIKSWPYLEHYGEIFNRINCVCTDELEAFYQPNKVISKEGMCLYIEPCKGDPYGE